MAPACPLRFEEDFYGHVTQKSLNDKFVFHQDGLLL
jgi:hypothetical protein